MTIQIVNLSIRNIFNRYSSNYKIFRDVFRDGLLGLEVRDIPDRLSERVKNIILGENEICYKSSAGKAAGVSLLITGDIKSLKELSRKIIAAGDEDLGYKIVNVIKNFEEYDSAEYVIGNRKFTFRNAYCMGILNMTPDSFSDGGKFNSRDSALEHALEMIELGADIIDIGAESSRPGAEPVDAEIEIKKIVPVIDEILQRKPDTIISVDTTKKKVAEKALSHGAKIINDISALNFEPDIIGVVAKYNASIILMHMKGIPKNMQANPQYEDVVAEIYEFFQEQVKTAAKAGVKNIIIDPGIGFGKTVEHNLEILKRLGDFKGLGYPLLIGVSRKSFIGKLLDLNTEDRDPATAMVETLAVNNGARIIRTHNVKLGAQVCRFLNNLN